MKIHALGTYPHYRDHLHAIHDHLPDGIRGDFVNAAQLKSLPEDDIVMVAGFYDVSSARGRRVIFVEHGAAQRYGGVRDRLVPYYGGPYPENVIAYLGPRQAAVDEVGLPGFAIGAPICDPYELLGDHGVCAITWHWNGVQVCVESGTALPFYVDRLGDIVGALRDNGWEVLGHRHPRLHGYRSIWRALDVPEVPVSEVREKASLLIADNTSLQYEMAYLCRQNIVVNSPRYRRDVEHGLRFWENPPGAQVDDADELIDMIEHLEDHLPRTYSTRAAVAAYDKSYSDGYDGIRAAAWVTSFVSSL